MRSASGNHWSNSRRSQSAPSPIATPTSSGAKPSAASSRSRRRATGESPSPPSPALSTAAKLRAEPGTSRIPPPPSGSTSQTTPTLTSRVVARPPSFPRRPAVSDDPAGTPVPSSATHKTCLSFNDLRTGTPSNDGSLAAPSPPTTVIDDHSSLVRHASTSSPTARVVRSTRFAPKFTPPTTCSSRSASS